MMEAQDLELAEVRAMLAAVPDGVIAPDSLTWTRLGQDYGVLHTGGEDGIVYSANKVASVSQCPDDGLPTMALIARAPSLVAVLVGALDKACKQAVTWRDERDEARAKLEQVEVKRDKYRWSYYDRIKKEAAALAARDQAFALLRDVLPLCQIAGWNATATHIGALLGEDAAIVAPQSSLEQHTSEEGPPAAESSKA